MESAERAGRKKMKGTLLKKNIGSEKSIRHILGKDHSVVADSGPIIEFTEVKNDESLSLICLSNGIELETNHEDRFTMNDTVSGYYFKALEDGSFLFGKAGKKIAILKLLDSNKPNHMSVSLNHLSTNEQRVYQIEFLEIKKDHDSGEEYLLVQANSDNDSPILSTVDSYILQKFSFSMRKIIKRYPGSIPVSTQKISMVNHNAIAGSVLSLIGIGLSVNSRTDNTQPAYFAVDVHLIASWLILNPKPATLKGN
jgi:hypothetical protein